MPAKRLVRHTYGYDDPSGARAHHHAHEDRDLLARLRQGCLAAAPGMTWTAAGRALAAAYDVVLDRSDSAASTRLQHATGTPNRVASAPASS